MQDQSISDENNTILQLLNAGPAAKSNALFIVDRLSAFSDLKRLHNISFVVNKGQIFGLFGLPGAGKSRLLEVLAGIQPFEEGDFAIWEDKLGFVIWKR